MKYFTRERAFTRRLSNQWERALRDYSAHFDAISPRLPESVRLWHDGRYGPTHDDVIETAERLESGVVCLEFSGGRLEFHRVTQWKLDVDEVPFDWLYEELDLVPPRSFGLRVLSSAGEMRIIAEELRFFSAREKRYLIPLEPPPPGPTLFLERKSRWSKRKSPRQ